MIYLMTVHSMNVMGERKMTHKLLVEANDLGDAMTVGARTFRNEAYDINQPDVSVSLEFVGVLGQVVADS